MSSKSLQLVPSFQFYLSILFVIVFLDLCTLHLNCHYRNTARDKINGELRETNDIVMCIDKWRKQFGREKVTE